MIKVLPWLKAALVVLMLIFAFGTYHYHGKVSNLKDEVAQLTKDVKAEKANTQAVIEEYNQLQSIYDETNRNRRKSQEKTDAAKEEHRRTGSVTLASPSDARLLQQRSREVRGDAPLASGGTD